MLEKRYDHKKISENKYDFWNNSGFFKCLKDKNKEPFTIILPPPNVTGKLHLGHASDTIPSDIIIRYKKAKGFDTLWVPGMDHAGIATQAKVANRLKDQGIDYHDLGREGFIKKTFEWKDEYASIIKSQWKALGLALDYNLERFTLEPKLNECVNKVFVSLYNKGLIYQGERIINYDPVIKTALSNVEVIYKEDKGKFYYFKYPIVNENDFLIIATTRPETMFGDTAVFVNPKDERYKKYINKKCINPANDQELIILADEYVDVTFGTGCMKCTPAHDPNDFTLSNKYKLPKILVMDLNGRMNDKCGPYKGLTREECRDKLVEDINKKGLLIKIEDIVHKVGHSERSDTVVEPILSKQWFVKMKPLAKRVIELQNSDKAIKFYPQRFSKTMIQWMENIDDWCISRQLWWGHRIPVYYKKSDGSILVSEKPPVDIENYNQDEDVLDTWFSSGLWPFTTLNWPDKNDEYYKRYFPTSLMVTGYDLIFFWVSRMVFNSLEFTDEPPFRSCLIHGLIRDNQGRKMSKSLNNGIDPFDVIEKYGIDALRLFLTTNSAPGLDMRYEEEKVASCANYLNKIWNSARYVLSLLEKDFTLVDIDFNSLDKMNKFILIKLNETIENVTKNMDKYELGQAYSYLYNFVYDDFCSYYLEMSKLNQDSNITKNVLYCVLKNIVLLIYPYAPFISEEIYQNIPNHLKSIMLESYPTYNEKYNDKNALEEINLLKTIIKDIRSYRVEHKLAINSPLNICINTKLDVTYFDIYLKRFCFVKNIDFNSNNSNGYTINYSELTLTISEDINKEELKAKLNKDLENINFEIKRCESLLNNENFINKAPQKKIDLEKEKLSKHIMTRDSILKMLDNID